MNRRLLWKLCGILALGTSALFWVISFVGSETERQMSFIAEPHQQTLRDWAVSYTHLTLPTTPYV